MSTRIPKINEAGFEEMHRRVRESFARLERGERVVEPLTPEQIEKLAERRPVEIFRAEMRQFRTPYDDQGGG